MTFQDYIRETVENALNAIANDDYYYCSDSDEVIDEMWLDDSITGNGSGSFTFNTAEAEENTRDLLWDDEFASECSDLDIKWGDLISQGAESVDVTARCLALLYAANEIRDAWDARKEEEEEETA